MSDRKKPPYAVGHKRPPPSHQFKPGQSGNPNGRPRGRKNFATLVQDLAHREVQVTLGGKKTAMTMAEALVQSAFKHAMSGNTKVLAVVLDLLQTHLGDDPTATRDPAIAAQELALVQQILNARGGADEPESD